MLAFNDLGNNGGLGNQMFQYAALRGIAANRGYGWAIPPFNVSRIDNYSLANCFKLEGLSRDNLFILDSGHAPIVNERYFHFDEELFNLCPDEISIRGFFQTEKYFKNIESEIRKNFTFHDEILNPCKEMIDSIDGDPIFLHVRRGDPNLVDAKGFRWSYTQCSSQYPLQPIEYYEKALQNFPEDQPIIVCSDSPEWVKEQEFFSGDRFLISEPEEKYPDGSYTPYVDLCLMSLCNGAIISPSTLSWWGAWLQTNRTNPVVAPDPWFGPNNANNNTKDLFPENWIKV
ncbi:alpha-1,2-fucosyltransferase [bacterium]|nr:alpha-1,2-fucosyltransferase [bacterium]